MKTLYNLNHFVVCVKYKTFVCDLCKTSHQAISHRVKSLTMSAWTMEEVNELSDENGGGNDAARHIWLSGAPNYGQRKQTIFISLCYLIFIIITYKIQGYSNGSRPKDGDRIEVYKKFIEDCYERGMFKSTIPYQPKLKNSQQQSTSNKEVSNQNTGSSKPAPVSNGSLSTKFNIPVTHVQPTVGVPTQSLIETSLIDFGDSFPSNNTTTATVSESAADFGSFQSAFPVTSSNITTTHKSNHVSSFYFIIFLISSY